MTTVVFAEHSVVEALPAGSVLTVVAPTDGEGFVQRMFAAAIVEEAAVASEETHTFGPYLSEMRFTVGCTAVSLAYSVAETTANLGNPMTGAGELVMGGTSGLPTRLANPGEGTFALQSIDGELTWTEVV